MKYMGCEIVPSLSPTKHDGYVTLIDYSGNKPVLRRVNIDVLENDGSSFKIEVEPTFNIKVFKKELSCMLIKLNEMFGTETSYVVSLKLHKRVDKKIPNLTATQFHNFDVVDRQFIYLDSVGYSIIKKPIAATQANLEKLVKKHA